MEQERILKREIDKWKLVGIAQDIYQSSAITLYMGELVDTETGEVFPLKIRWSRGMYELYKPA